MKLPCREMHPNPPASVRCGSERIFSFFHPCQIIFSATMYISHETTQLNWYILYLSASKYIFGKFQNVKINLVDLLFKSAHFHLIFLR